MSHSEMLLLMSSETEGHISKTALRCGVQWKSFFRVLASGSHYGRASALHVLHSYKLSTLCEI